MAAYAALVSLMNTIEQIRNHPRLSTSLTNKQIQPLLEKASFLLDFIEGCHTHGGGSKETEDLERRMASAAHAAVDVIESHIVNQIHAGTSKATVGLSLDLQLKIVDINVIIKKATKEKQGWREDKSTHTSEAVMESGETAMVGLDDELTQLLDELTGYQSSRQIISIVGMGGMGKTTLAKNIYQNPLIMEHFEIRAWATISQQYKAEEILAKLLSDTEKSTGRTADAVGEELHKTLSQRRYLIVLDDMWSVEAWDKVRRYFPDNGNRSRVVLTTRLSNVAKDCGSSCLNMNLLDDDQSWKLFCEKALFPLPQKDNPPQLEDLGKQIVKSCKGLALSIAVIGGLLLKSPRTVEFWKGIAQDIKSIPNSKENLDVLCLSYNNLPPHLKPCFLYMGVFEEDSEIRISKIIKLWVGEGFLKPKGSQDLEEVAEGYLKDLIDRNLILVGRRRSNGKIGFCGVHDLLRDLSLKIAEQQQFFDVITFPAKLRGTERRLLGSSWSLDYVELPLARSIIRHKSLIRLGVECRLLRVFDQGDGDYSFKNSSSEDYSGYVNLRYLSYLCPCISSSVFELPSSVSLVWNLQTLNIKPEFEGRKLVVVAPAEFWKMQQLRHVECEIIHLPNLPQDEVLVLEKLQTVKTALNLRLCEEMCKIIPNIKKLHLSYDDKSHIECLCNLYLLHKLESLYMRFFTLDSELNRIVKFPSCLKKLSLEGCGLHWEDMTMIGSLPQLQVLKLEHGSVTKGREWSPVDEQFLRLKFLKIDSCELIEWNADNSHFPVLEKLVLIQLSELKEIPQDMGEIPTLELIRVDRCSESASISALKMKEDLMESEGNDGLQIQVRVDDFNVKSFKERVETEDLTINNIQLEVWHNWMRSKRQRRGT